MTEIQFRNFQPGDAAAMAELQSRCVDLCPDTGKFEPGFWFSPGFENGRNILIAAEARGGLVGYAAITSAYYSNTLEARVFWIDLRSDPGLDPHLKVKDKLLKDIIRRGKEMKVAEKRPRAAIGATYFAQGQASIAYLKARGFAHFETSLAMRKDLSAPLPELGAIFPGIQIKPWKMESREEKIAYLAAREAAFGYPLQTLEILEHFTQSELWQGGTSLSALSEGAIVGSVMALANGLLDYVFVLPAWQRRGIARNLVLKALEFLRERDHAQAWLEVLSHNEAAVGLYRSLGFETFKEEISLGYLLD